MNRAVIVDSDADLPQVGDALHGRAASRAACTAGNKKGIKMANNRSDYENLYECEGRPNRWRMPGGLLVDEALEADRVRRIPNQRFLF